MIFKNYIDWEMSEKEADLLEATKLVLCDIWHKGDSFNKKFRKNFEKKFGIDFDQKALLCEDEGKHIPENKKATEFARNLYNELTEKFNYDKEKAVKFIKQAAMRAGGDMKLTRLIEYGITNSHVLRKDAILSAEEAKNHHECTSEKTSFWEDFKAAWNDLVAEFKADLKTIKPKLR